MMDSSHRIAVSHWHLERATCLSDRRPPLLPRFRSRAQSLGRFRLVLSLLDSRLFRMTTSAFISSKQMRGRWRPTILGLVRDYGALGAKSISPMTTANLPSWKENSHCQPMVNGSTLQIGWAKLSHCELGTHRQIRLHPFQLPSRLGVDPFQDRRHLWK